MIKILKFVPYLLVSLIFLSTKVYADGHAIKIGVSFRMLSDVGYKHGELIKDTVAEWNEAGGINGHPIELTLYNDECKSEKGVANATKLAYEDKVHVIIGSSCSSVTLPMVPVSAKAKVPQIIPHSTNTQITLEGSDYIFRVPISSRFYKLVQGKYTAENQGTKIAYIYGPDAAGKDFALQLQDYMRDNHGEEPTYSVQSGEKETDFRSYLLKAKATNPEVLVISALLDETVRGLVQSYEVGIPESVHRVTASIGSKVEIPTNAGDAARGVTFSAAFASSDQRSIAKMFVEMVQNRYGVVPGHDFSQMWDLLEILRVAMENTEFSGDLAADRDALRDSIANTTNYSGLASGPIDFCADNTPQCRDGNKTPVMIEYTKGGKNFETRIAGTVTFESGAGL